MRDYRKLLGLSLLALTGTLVLAGVLGAALMVRPTPVVKKVTKEQLEFPVKFGPGDLIRATGRLKARSSQFFQDKERGMLVQCDQFADKVNQPTVAFQVCYFDVLPSKGNGHPAELQG